MKTGNYRIPANRPQHCSAGSVTIPAARTTYTCVLPNRPQPPGRSTPSHTGHHNTGGNRAISQISSSTLGYSCRDSNQTSFYPRQRVKLDPTLTLSRRGSLFAGGGWPRCKLPLDVPRGCKRRDREGWEYGRYLWNGGRRLKRGETKEGATKRWNSQVEEMVAREGLEKKREKTLWKRDREEDYVGYSMLKGERVNDTVRTKKGRLRAKERKIKS